jgi:hypothetical protein
MRSAANVRMPFDNRVQTWSRTISSLESGVRQSCPDVEPNDCRGVSQRSCPIVEPNDRCELTRPCPVWEPSGRECFHGPTLIRLFESIVMEVFDVDVPHSNLNFVSRYSRLVV